MMIMKGGNIAKTALLFVGALGFNILFWQENLGVNLLIYSAILILFGILSVPDRKVSKQAIVSAIGVIVAGVFVVYHNSFMAKFVNMTSIVMFIGFINQKQLKQVFHAIPTSLGNLGLAPSGMWNTVTASEAQTKQQKKFGRTLKLTIIPALFFSLFYTIFYLSNPTFKEFSDEIWNDVFFWLEDLFKNFSFAWILLFFLGLAITAWSLFRSEIKHFLKIEEKLSPDITRSEIKRKRNKSFIFKTLDLKNEYRSALYMIGSINVLLFVVNFMDIRGTWFDFEYLPSMNLSQFVHEGTYLLIFSILLSIGILLYFFRKNLNFYRKNKRLALFASIWIFQNLILVISVAVRNYQYIHHYGLAYKRIGVFVFLAATLVGLVTLYFKITKKKSIYYLLGVNSWSVYGLLIIMSMVNWDMIIVNHNVNHPNKENIDVKFLLTLSDKTLPVIQEHRKELKIDSHHSFWAPSEYGFILDKRIDKFKKRKEETTWRSWNYAEEQAIKALETKK